MTEHVRYIEKTRDYYRALGYPTSYAWAKHDECPFTPLEKSLAECRIGLVSTASLVRLGEDGAPLETWRIMGTGNLEVYSVRSDWPVARLRSTSEDHDRFQTDMSDVNAYFPKDHLRDFVDEGLIGGFAEECIRVLPNYSQRKVSNVDAPEVLRRARKAEVDAVVLTPV